VARMEQDATTALAQARTAGDAAAGSAALGAKAIFSALLLGLGAAMLGAWIGTRHARVLAPIHEAAHDTHTTADVTQATYGPPPTPTSVHVYDETSRPVPAYLREVTFPATKQELLRAVRREDEPAALRRLEQLPDRSFSSVTDVISALLTTA